MILKTLVGLFGCFLKSGSLTAHIAIGNAPDHEINDGADRGKTSKYWSRRPGLVTAK